MDVRAELQITLNLHYPVLATADAKVFVDGLLVSKSHGLVAFDLSSQLDARPTDEQLKVLTLGQHGRHP
jgi:superfamily I DNA and RNA helicase